MIWDTQQIRSAVAEVEQRLAADPDGKRLALYVPPDGFQVDEEWLLVIVEPGVPDVRGIEYVDALIKVEGQIRQHGLDHVTLVPTTTR